MFATELTRRVDAAAAAHAATSSSPSGPANADASADSVTITPEKAAEFFANSCHPGIVDTSLFATAQYAFAGRLLRPLLSTPSDGAKTSVFLAADETTMLATDEPDPAKREQKRRAHRGQYWEPYGKLASLPGSARDPEQLRALWDATEALLAEKGFGGSWPGLTTEA
ncbi:hypothetical protein CAUPRSCDRAFT_12980 [Caulochytrium protostelioides]|uniref:Uncharacterized protein n=1 Tax=Caulochytrium protostelioides TaxID=1555241 RepID=A0A4P9WSY6_9FUNG|nr:hypothetical protein CAUPRSCDRAFT_12980 [Caulochytrium protostelioides]